MAGAGEGAQSLDRRHQFHAVVGGIAFAAGQFLFMLAITDDCSPTATARIALAGPIGEHLSCGELAAHAPSNALALAVASKSRRRRKASGSLRVTSASGCVLIPDRTSVVLG